MRGSRSLVAVVVASVLASVVASVVACSGDDGGPRPDGGVGHACTRSAECAPGLVCAGGGCAAAGTIRGGDACSASRDCVTGFHCAVNGTCAPVGGGAQGTPCSSSADCVSGLTCDLDGFAGTCAPGGSADLGAACATTDDCIAGLVCSASDLCERSVIAYPPFGGVVCPPDESPFRAYWQLPRADRRLSDFFRLPFPTDARIAADGTLDLSDFPRPGPTALGVDLVASYVDALSADFDGFSPVAPVTFRFSSELEFSTLRDDTVGFVDITDPARPGAPLPRAFAYDADRQKLACQHRLHVSTRAGTPLLPRRTYAVYLTTGIRAKTGAAPTIEPDLAAVLAEAQPADAAQAAAWTHHATFRAYLATAGIAPSSIAAVAVFRVQDAPAHVAALAAATEARPLPVLRDLTLCAPGVTSPCAPPAVNDGDRACGDGDGPFHEIHGRFTVPGFQAGSPPFETPADGGAVAVADGRPQVQGDLDVCFALTIPKADAPAAGWPLVVHAHGTGGSFRAAVTGDIAAALASAPAPMATFTFDGVAHGARRGASTRSPDSLVFNVVNPRAARDNHLQGAVDVLQALRVARVEPFEVAGAGVIDLDADRVAFFGHSQGATVGIPALAASDAARGAVLSGAGSFLTEGILGKTSPVNAKRGLEALVGEELGGGHPMMVVWQTFFDRVDPLHHARGLVIAPGEGVRSKHVLQTWSATDTYAPKATLTLTAQASGLRALGPVLESLEIATVTRPEPDAVRAGDGELRTAIVAQYATAGAYDGHFVATRHPQAIADWTSFLAAIVEGAPVRLP